MNYRIIVLNEAADFLFDLKKNRKKLGAKMIRVIDLLEHYGNQLRYPYTRKLKNSDIWELRAQHASDICRLFYFYHKDSVYVALCGYIKKEQKTKKNIIEKAEKIRKQYIEGETS